ncbi:hypothetical protein [Aquisalimonas lutea]|uniref:hypothetical protein n=1 Tax=Aquisalimonas lutea TaxID=1327750 RepID=UPI003F493325
MIGYSAWRTPARILTFSFGTRDSFVVLETAVALPDGWETAVVVIVFQTLMELFGMVVFLSWLPRKPMPNPGPM